MFYSDFKTTRPTNAVRLSCLVKTAHVLRAILFTLGGVDDCSDDDDDDISLTIFQYRCNKINVDKIDVACFLRAKAECFARLCHRLGVCPSVCLSVCLSVCHTRKLYQHGAS